MFIYQYNLQIYTANQMNNSLDAPSSSEGWNAEEAPDSSRIPPGLYNTGYGGSYTCSVKKTNTRNTTKNPKNQNDKEITQKESQQSNRNQPTLGFKYLEILSSKNSYDILIELITRKEEFLQILNDDNLNNDYIIIILSILTKICYSNFAQIKFDFISAAQNVFLYTLHSYINQILNEKEKDHLKNRFYWCDVESFWNNLFTFISCLVKILENKYYDKVGQIINCSGICLNNLYKSRKINTFKFIIQKYEQLQTEFCIHEQKVDNEAKTEPISFENFIYPQATDIKESNQGLMPLIVKGAYPSIEDYLEMQSSLVKEDFFIPFRKGISEYLTRNTIAKQYIFYQNVVFIEETLIRNKLCLIIRIANDNRSKTNSKHFMYGSLLCLSCDNFSSLLFATVEDSGDIARGYLVIRLCEVYDISKMFSGTTFVMIESEVYFEPYFHVLNSINHFDNTNFPMVNYIVNVQTRTQFPQYALDIINYNYKGVELSILDTDGWPQASDVGLNASQLEAVKVALTNDLALIQGPPGTGKTYISTEIATILLKNIKQPRILIVCYTNQALDQFLLGISSVTNDIVRIGNQSSELALSKYHISKRLHPKSSTLAKALRKVEAEILEVVKVIKNNHHNYKILNSNKGILCMDDNKFATELQDENWLQKSTTLLSPLANWLLGNRRENCLAIPECVDVVTTNLKDDTTKNQQIHQSSDSFDPINDLKITLDSFNVSSNWNFDITIDDLKNSIHKLDEQIGKLELQDHVEDYLNELREERNEMVFWMRHLAIHMNTQASNTDTIPSVSNSEILNLDDRWKLYWRWLEYLKTDLMRKSTDFNTKYQQLCKQYEELKFIHYINTLKDTQVIGMTTTSAARLHVILEELKIPIVIIEEAAEIPEAHAVASLTAHCQHLIMVGDHKQLRPQSAVHDLSENYNLKISLFERLINNNIQSYTLEEQYRMRPEIASLITPLFYNNLINNLSVTKYPKIAGISKSLHFITHQHMEDMTSNSSSHSNKHEAHFLTKLCHYLLLNKYDASDITILTTYSAQKLLIQKEIQNIPILKNVKVVVVDNFQGKENKIILLSLVRSNKDSNIGFLNTRNRVCVALSRAREGLFIIGNMNNLSKKSMIWEDIKQNLITQNAISDHIQLEIRKLSSTLWFKAYTGADFTVPLSHFQ